MLDLSLFISTARESYFFTIKMKKYIYIYLASSCILFSASTEIKDFLLEYAKRVFTDKAAPIRQRDPFVLLKLLESVAPLFVGGSKHSRILPDCLDIKMILDY